MKAAIRILSAAGLAGFITSMLVTSAAGDPLQGEVLKFQQLPLDNLTYPVGDPVGGFVDQTYWGHDEFSTAYNQSQAGIPAVYVGKFMADDFADGFNSPIVHVRWWGSYLVRNPDFPVDKFLISFEEDVPADQSIPGSFSHPGAPLLNQVVTRDPLFSGSGTFTELPISPGGPPLDEELLQYNAELNLGEEFPEMANKVYWLKIVALVDTPGILVDPSQPIPPNITQWGWHDRDYTKYDSLASAPPDVDPGERLEFFLDQTPGVAGYHFQDDAVTGDVTVDFTPVPGIPFPLFPDVRQDQMTFQPMNYLDGIDGPGPGPFGEAGIGSYSKDLAFELYTVVPEPTSCVLMLLGATLAGMWRRRVLALRVN
jgi:PEP-CTERM motif